MIYHFGQTAEAIGFLTYQHGGDFVFNYRDEILCQKQRITAAGTGILNRSAIAVSDLSVLQDEHNGNGLSGWTDGGETGGYRIANISGAVSSSPFFNGALIVEEETGSAFGANNFGNFHDMTTPFIISLWVCLPVCLC